MCVRAGSRPPPPLGSQCKTSSGSPGGCFILEWAAQWREDGGCFPALKAPQLAPLTNRAASSLWGRLFSELHGDKHTVSLPAPPGSAQPHASPPGHSKLRTTPRQVVHLALSSCLLANDALVGSRLNSFDQSFNRRSVLKSVKSRGRCASLVECRIPSAPASTPRSASVRSGDSRLSPFSPPIWSLQRKVNTPLIQVWSQRQASALRLITFSANLSKSCNKLRDLGVKNRLVRLMYQYLKYA